MSAQRRTITPLQHYFLISVAFQNRQALAGALGRKPHLYYWRSHDGLEVDLLIAIGGKLQALEIKLTATPNCGMQLSAASGRRSANKLTGVTINRVHSH